jgi:acyl-CoA carboxylase subunit alpha
VLRHPAFLEGTTDTAFFETHGLAELSAPLADTVTVRLSAIAAALADAAHNRATATVFGSLPSGWRNLSSGYQVKTYRDDSDSEQNIEYRFTRTALALPNDPTVQLVSSSPDEVVLADSGVACSFAVARFGDDIYIDSARGPVHLVALPRFPEPGSAVAQGSLVAPMPGNVIRVGAEVGETVAAGQPLIWLEAMKMEHTITAPTDGILAELNVQTGQQVEVGAVLGVIASAAPPGEAGHDHQTGVIASAAPPGEAGHDHQTGVIASAAPPGEAGHDHQTGVIASAAGHDHPDPATVKAPESERDPS